MDGKPFAPRKYPRTDHATGRPLDPHLGESRAFRLLRATPGLKGGTVTVWWSHSFGVILGYHARGQVRGAPVRDSLGLAPAGLDWTRAQARLFWRNLVTAHGVVALPGAGGGPRPGPKPRPKPEVKPKPAPPPVLPPKPPVVPKPTKPPKPPRETVAGRTARLDEESRQRYLAQVAAKDAHTAAAIEAAAKPGADLRVLIDRDLYRDDGTRRTAIAAAFVAAHSRPGEAAARHGGMAEPEAMRTVEFAGMRVHYAATAAGEHQAARTLGYLVTDRSFGRDRVTLPPALVPHAHDLYFTGQRNKDDDYWAKQYDRPGLVTAATGGGVGGQVVVYNGHPLTGWQTIAHEAGHNFARAKYGDTTPPRGSAFHAAGAAGEAPPTDYGKANPAEDFAESVQLFARQPDHLKRIAPKRHAVVKRLMEDPGYGG